MVTLIAVGVMMILVAGALQLSSASREASAAKMQADQMSACTENARRYLMSRLRVFGVQVTDLKLDSAQTSTFVKLPDSDVPADRTTIGLGHYGDTAGTTIKVLSASAFGASARQVFEDVNTTRRGSLGGQYYRVTMVCAQPGQKREAEVEFVFRFGI